MGFFKNLFGRKEKQNEQECSWLDTNNIYDVIYAFTFLAASINCASPGYIRVSMDDDSAAVEVLIDKESFGYWRPSGNLNSAEGIRSALGGLRDIADFIISLNCSYSDEDYFQLKKMLDNSIELDEELLESIIVRAKNEGNAEVVHEIYMYGSTGALIQFGKI